MNYREFLEYRDSVPSSLVRLDDLNPYTIGPYFNDVQIEIKDLLLHDDYFILHSSGVRPLLKEFLKRFTVKNYQLSIPNDIYPEYFNLVPNQCDIFQYSSFRKPNFAFSKQNLSVALVTNPLVPEGRYLTYSELDELDGWLMASDNRWIIFDNVYDYNLGTLAHQFRSKNIIFLNSLTKINLNPGSKGWALCKRQLSNFEPANEVLVDGNRCFAIQKQYTSAWKAIDAKHNLKQLFNWTPPEVGYLSTISRSFEELRKRYGIASIPSSIFGIAANNVSVVSCLSEIKHDLF